MIRDGMKNNEISKILHVALKTVCFHRMNIRKKLKLVNSKTNLQAYLLKLK
jgi:DNA-binding CsgD family transcriptional regulator